MLTAYDYLSAQILDQAGIPVILVGDTLGMVMLGYDSTVPVTVDEMLHHTRAVMRARRRRWWSATCPSAPTRPGPSRPWPPPPGS